MKIVLAAHQFLPDFIGGTEVLTFETARELQNRGHEVTVWAGFPSERLGTVEQYDHEGVKVVRYHFSRKRIAAKSDMMETGYRNEEFGKIFRAHLTDCRPEIIHFFHLGRLSLTAVEAGNRLGIPMVFTATDYWMICPTSHLRLPDNTLCNGPATDMSNCLRHLMICYGPPLARKSAPFFPASAISAASSLLVLAGGRFSRPIASLRNRPAQMHAAMESLSRIIVPTRMMRNLFLRSGVKKAKMVLQPFGVSVGTGAVTPAKQQDNALRIGFIGTLSEIKGPHVLLSAVSRLPHELKLEVKIYGKAVEYREYGEQIGRMAAKDPRVRCCGAFPPSELGNILSGLDVLVVPSLWYENTPLVIHAAQAAKVPVIASDIGGMSEIIGHEQNGLLFELGNAQALAAQIGRLAEDRVLLKRLSAQAREPKSMAAYVDEIEDIYQMVLREKRQGLT